MRLIMLVEGGIRLIPENELDEDWVNTLIVKTPRIIGVELVSVAPVGFAATQTGNDTSTVLAVELGPKK